MNIPDIDISVDSINPDEFGISVPWVLAYGSAVEQKFDRLNFVLRAAEDSYPLHRHNGSDHEAYMLAFVYVVQTMIVLISVVRRKIQSPPA